MTNRIINRLGKFSAISMVLLVIAALIFRATLYWWLPVAPGEPAGGGDVIELLLFFGILLVATVTMVIGLLLMIVPAWRDMRLGIVVLIISLISPPLYFILHSMIPRLV